nr:MAG TPA: hypothetical protein [Caudoviricetes sp.]
MQSAGVLLFQQFLHRLHDLLRLLHCFRGMLDVNAHITRRSVFKYFHLNLPPSLSAHLPAQPAGTPSAPRPCGDTLLP